METREFKVSLGSRSYPIHIGSGLFDCLGVLCRDHHLPDRLVVLADSNSARVGMKKVLASLRSEGFRPLSIIMPHGERQKSFARAAMIHAAMLNEEIPRNAALIALGGGVVGDVGGFVASTYRRGLKFIQCPTTLLSQVDSSVGGKNGLNHPLSKNAIGTFHQPVFVLSDLDALKSLPRREIVSGLGEILKYPFVGDPELFNILESRLESILHADPNSVLEIASRCLRIKARFVSRDERELLKTNGRVLLNGGHAVGHALETLSSYRLRHGEAVLLGLIAEGGIAADRGWLHRSTFERLVGMYHMMKCRLNIREITDRSIVQYVLSKHRQRFVLPFHGKLRVVGDVSERELLQGLRIVRAL